MPSRCCCATTSPSSKPRSRRRPIGAYATPINWHGTPDEIGYILRDCGARVLVGHDDLLAGLGDAVPAGVTVLAVATPMEIAAAYGVPEGATLPGRRDWDDWIAAAADKPEPPPAPQTGSMIYTSGTTGRPKGVRRQPTGDDERAARHANTERAYGLIEGEAAVVLMNGPMYHSAPNGYGLTALRVGATIVLEPRFDPAEMLQLIERHRVTHMHMVPTMFTRLLRLPEATRQRHDLSSLRFVVHGAAPCPPALKQAMIDWWGPVINEYYGSTETGIPVWHSSEEALLQARHRRARPARRRGRRLRCRRHPPAARRDRRDLYARRRHGGIHLPRARRRARRDRARRAW